LSVLQLLTIEHLTPGVYAVLATNDEEGYSIENQSPGQSVTVAPDPNLNACKCLMVGAIGFEPMTSTA